MLNCNPRGERYLKDTEYVDDAALLADTLMAVVALTNYLANGSEMLELKINFPKTEIMAVTKKCGPLQKAVVNNDTIEAVENYA